MQERFSLSPPLTQMKFVDSIGRIHPKWWRLMQRLIGDGSSLVVDTAKALQVPSTANNH